MITEELKIALLNKSNSDDTDEQKVPDEDDDKKEIFDPNEEGLDDLGIGELVEDEDDPLSTGEEDKDY